MMKHIEDNHEQPLHTCGKSEELAQNSTDFNNNGTRVTQVEPMEIESEGFGAGLDSYMANRPKQSKDLQKALRDFRKTW